ncbi:MAG: SUMF1/EgtB/PvdO family nonheme iron enzyme [Candidatus Cloacimonetes bacterium]|nr:SUMF1/EgtB/PvdO family nonheme iron enzyme [Candidatus Cloacimonadota bacterium]
MRTNVVSHAVAITEDSLGWNGIRPNQSIRPFALLALFILCINLAFADPLALQSFENLSSDTWAYTADPSSAVPFVWGRSYSLAGVRAQDQLRFWASSLMDPIEASVSFSNVAITPGTQHSLSFFYYTKNLNPATDQIKVCLEYDNGSEWNNWQPLLLNTQFWSHFSFNIPQTASTARVKILTQYTNPNSEKYAHWDNFSIKAEEADLTAAVVFNTSVVQRTDGSKLVDIYYDLFDANGGNCEIGLKLSEDGGSTFNIIPSPALLTGDIGENIAPGFGKHIIWDAGSESRDFDGDQFMASFSAENGQYPMPENFVFVEGGTIYPTTGQYTSGLTVSDFYIGKYEVTVAEWEAVMGYNTYDNYPKNLVSWFDAIEYCNRRSMQEGLTPCYSYLTYGTNPDNWPAGWNYYMIVGINVSCDWTATGYRLPSEEEWEYAARGGLQTHGYTYSGSNDLNAVGWYDGNSGGSSHPVGQLADNELGIFDMSGNLFEMCWYTSNDRLPICGGCWHWGSDFCDVSYHSSWWANDAYSEVGFRVCRTSP